MNNPAGQDTPDNKEDSEHSRLLGLTIHCSPAACRLSGTRSSQDYGTKTYKEIKDLTAGNPPDPKARQMKKLIEQAARLQQKGKGRRS